MVCSPIGGESDKWVGMKTILGGRGGIDVNFHFFGEPCSPLKPDLAPGGRTRSMIIVPIEFWQNSVLFKKRTFSRPKIDKIRAFFRNLSKFHEKIAKICNKNL